METQEAKVVANFLIADLENEMQTTLRVFGAVPGGKLDYRPDPVSKTALGLLRHITLEDEWILNCTADGVFMPPPNESDACGIMTPADAIARYKERIPAGIKRVVRCPASSYAGKSICWGCYRCRVSPFCRS